jgi:hypothetical protein
MPPRPSKMGSLPPLQEVGGLLALIATAAYALAYLLQSVFYGHFGLTPDQVGVDKVGALLRLVPAIFIAVAVAALVLGVLVAISRALWSVLPLKAQVRVPFRAFVTLPYVTLFMIGIVVSAVNSADDRVFFRVGGVGLAVMVPVAVVSFLHRVLRELVGAWARPAIVVALFMLVGLLGAIWVDTKADALQQDGLGSTTLSIIGIPVGYAAVHWVDPARRPPSVTEQPLTRQEPPHIMVIIGESSTSYTLFDCATQVAYMVSSSDVVVDRAYSWSAVNQDDWLHRGLNCSP